MELLYILLVLLVLTRAFGEVAERLGQPVLVGELISGIALGLLVSQFSDSFPVLSTLEENEVFLAITELGMFFLMLHAGVELRPGELYGASRSAFLVALGGMVFPLGLGLALGWMVLPASDVRGAQALFLGTCLAVTAVPVSVKILLDLGKLKSELGRVIVTAALVDDVLSLLLLAVLTAVMETGSFPEAAGLVWLVARVLGFFAITYACGRWVLPAVGRRLHALKADELGFSFLIIVALGFSVLAEALGLHFILGAFAAGLFFGRHAVEDGIFDSVKANVSAVSTGFLAPIFFASVGLHLDLAGLREIPGTVALLLVLATVGKLVGATVPARLSGFSNRDSLAVGTAMNARGAVELVIADVALRAGILDRPSPTPPVVENLYSAVVIMAIVTTLVTPFGLRALLRRS